MTKRPKWSKCPNFGRVGVGGVSGGGAVPKKATIVVGYVCGQDE